MQIPRLFNHCYGMPALTKPRMMYLLSQAQFLQHHIQLHGWSLDSGSDTHFGRFYPNSSISQSTVKFCLFGASAGEDVLPRIGEAPHQCCQHSWKPYLQGAHHSFLRKGTEACRGAQSLALQQAKRGACVKRLTTSKASSVLERGLLPSQKWANTI